MKVRYASRARSDISAICSYIAKENPRAAKQVKASIVATITLVAARPYVGIKNARAAELRSRLVSGYPYRVHYVIRDQELVVLHVQHGARQPLERRQ